MSPEQVRGKSADARSDIFSFGAILYEMLSGRRAFQGDTAADTMSAILKEDPPDLSVTNQNISPGLERIVRHCLEKNPEQRFHSAHDLAFDLEALSTSSGAPSAVGGVKAVRGPRVRVPLLAAAAVVAVGIALGHFVWKPTKPSSPTYRRLTFRRGNVGTARFAPDGRSVVYGASWEGRPIEIYTTRPEGPSRRRSAFRAPISFRFRRPASSPSPGASVSWAAPAASVRWPRFRWVAGRRGQSPRTSRAPIGHPTENSSRSFGSSRAETASSFPSASSSTRRTAGSGLPGFHPAGIGLRRSSARPGASPSSS